MKVKEEFVKQLQASFLEATNYLEWLANVVQVAKKDGKVRNCDGYRDLNKASPINDFPLSHIYVLVDNIVGYALFSFMDSFSGYNEIRLALEDKEKASFITPCTIRLLHSHAI